MAKLAPLSAAELDHELAVLDPAPEVGLRELHRLLMRAAPLAAEPPYPALSRVAGLVARLPNRAADRLPPRPRTAFRLLRVGAMDAAWAVLVDNAVGVVAEPVDASTSSGGARRSWPLPLLTRIEAPSVFADLPGFRDPRYGAPDTCYDITDRVKLRHNLDELRIQDGTVAFGGWVALDWLKAAASELVTLIASHRDAEVSAVGLRLRRPDLVSGKADASELRAWAGWSAYLDLGDPRLVDGAWALSLELDHGGVSRRTPLGAATGDLSLAATKGVTQMGARSVSWETGGSQWSLVIASRS